MNILHLTFSSRGELSESRKLSKKIVDMLIRLNPNAELIARGLGDGTLPHIDAEYASMQHSNDAGQPGTGSSARSDQLIAELERADVIVIGTPMHNLSVPSSLKAWIDHVVHARRTFTMTSAGKKGMLHDRPVYIAVASGGRFSGANAHQPDFLTSYLKTILASIGLCDVRFFTIEGTGGRAESVEVSQRIANQELTRHFNSLGLKHACENLD